ncbi:MAG: hypothetical protein P8L77_04655 [Gammaproteobacteria bacterium]|nr:hypothetical protein [Gammaproteobacteria bacterium]
MNIHFSPIGHSMAYAQLNSLEHWLFSSDDVNMPLNMNTVKDFLAERPLTIEANGHVETFPTFIHYCLSKPVLAQKESSFTIKLAQIFSHIEPSLIVDMLLTQNNRGQNCYDEALNQHFKALACFFEKTIEAYNLKTHNKSAPEILKALTDDTISIEAFSAKVSQIDPSVFEAIVKTNTGGRINCAQAILYLKQNYPNKAKYQMVESLLGKDKLIKLLQTNPKPLASLLKTKEKFENRQFGNLFSKTCPTSPIKLKTHRP